MAVIAETPSRSRSDQLNSEIFKRATVISQKLTEELWAQSLLTLIVFLCYDLDKLGILMDLLSFWTLYTVKFEKAEAISLHVILGSCFLISSGFFSILKLTGLVFWTISFKSLQEKHENRIKNNLNQRKKVENFNLERNLNQLTASMQSIMKPLIRIGKKKLGISEVVIGRPLFILNEIYSTEKTYVNNLNALVTVYQEPMQAICTYDDGFLNQQSIRIIFQHLKVILNLHSKILSAMEREVTNGHVSGKNISPFIIGNFCGEILESYSLYMKAFDKKTEELTKLKKSEKFCNFLTSQLLNEKCNGQPIDALLIRPIQRIPSLLLLYKDLYKELNAMDSMYSFYIKEVVDQLNDLLLKLNHEKGMDEGRQRLLEMATSIEQFPQDIVSSQRIATEKTTIQVEQDGNIGDFRISKGKTKLNLYLLTDLIIISKLKQRGLVNKTNKEIYMTTIMHDSIRGLYRMQDRPNEYALEYKLGSEDERQFLVFTTTDFSNTFSEKLIELKGNLEIGTLHLDDLKSKTKVKKRTKSFDRISSSHRSSINIDL